MKSQSFVLRNNHIRQRAIHVIENTLTDEEMLRQGLNPANYMVVIKKPTRSIPQNAKLHALFADASKYCTWQGRQLTPTQWKVLFISGHSMATGLGADMVPGLEGEFVNIRESSAQMSVARMNSLIEYVQAWVEMNKEFV